MSDDLREFYITFGTAHLGIIRGAHPDGYVVIVAGDYHEAREIAFEITGGRFAFIYENVPNKNVFHLGETARYGVGQ